MAAAKRTYGRGAGAWRGAGRRREPGSLPPQADLQMSGVSARQPHAQIKETTE